MLEEAIRNPWNMTIPQKVPVDTRVKPAHDGAGFSQTSDFRGATKPNPVTLRSAASRRVAVNYNRFPRPHPDAREGEY